MAQRRNHYPRHRNTRNSAHNQRQYYSPDNYARQVHVEEVYAPQPVPVRWIRRGRRPIGLRKDIQERIWNHILSYLVVLAFFGGLAGIVSLNAQLSYERMHFGARSAELAQIQNSNEARLGEIQANLVNILPTVEYYAINEFGMTRPQEFQVRELRAPRRSFTTGD
ncbi:MAG: hypothetical protein LBE35_00055 [Clostridiales bacterium]|jgi:hypothetical protein|nr:hypothetical protein [Clostridiales bacterium]